MRDNVDADKRIPDRPPPWMAFCWRDFMIQVMPYLDKTEDVGIYFTMMGLAWLRGDGSVPADMAELKKLLQFHLRDLHGHTFNRAVPPMLERFFERRGDKFIHRGVENELRVASGFKEKWMKRRTSQSKQKQNEATSGKINGLGATTVQDSTVHIREDNKLEAWRGSQVVRKRVSNGFHSLAHHLRTGTD
jgi:uncharacterized protein YdaU (DUF1376 family)